MGIKDSTLGAMKDKHTKAAKKRKKAKEVADPVAVGKNKFTDKSGKSLFAKTKSLGPAAASGKVGANAWEQLGEQEITDKSTYRDVHNKQQLRRGKIGDVKGYRMATIGSIVAGVASANLFWFVWGIIGWIVASIGLGGGIGGGSNADFAEKLGVPPYVIESQMPIGTSSRTQTCYQEVDPTGNPVGECMGKAGEIKEPQWHKDMLHQAQIDADMIKTEDASEEKTTSTLGGWIFFGEIGLWRVLCTLLVGAGVGGIVYTVLRKQIDARNVMYDVEDINQYEDDQHLALIEETVERYSHFPDVGAHSPEQPSSMISHIMLSKKGLKNVEQTLFADSDVIDEEGNLVYIKGEQLRDEQGQLKTKTVPIIDEEFGQALFEASGVPENKRLRRLFDASKIAYNPGGRDREKVGKERTLAEHINSSWEYPDYEVQRPAGSYVVDVAPVNTMVLAITRAGKGQTYIEPMIDMWLREKRPNNLVVNDPKGELLVKHYVRATMRGFEVVQFNLINALKTDIYNPLGMAAQAARAGDTKKAAMIVNNIAEVFFPIDGADDPVWPSAANNAFKRTAYGLIDFYLEEEAETRNRATQEGWEPAKLNNVLDEMWGKVTLFNCYQFFVQLSGKKLKDPMTRLQERLKNGEMPEYQNEGSEDQRKFEEEKAKAEEQRAIWVGEQELDMLTLFFNATDQLPSNSMRELVGNADKSLRSMGAAEKMLASVYGIAITAMSFFTDPTISTLTSGTPGQNFDLSSTSFPRKFGVRLDENYIASRRLLGAQVKWTGYKDAGFTEKLGGDFTHEDTIGRDGWARAFFAGKFPNDVSYIKLELYSKGSGMLLDEMFFKFVKGYQTNLKGQAYLKDPITGQKIVKDGLLIELKPKQVHAGRRADAGTKTVYVPGDSTFKRKGLNLTMLDTKTLLSSNIAKHVGTVDVDARTIISTDVSYSERTKAIFLVTPPHLTAYAKLLLILVKQLVDQNFDASYMTKENQKPLYKTRYMLDELGNLQSEGHGIAGFETMLSIGLGQEQQFTLILQTVQQLRDVYGDSVDKIVQGNAQPVDARVATPTGWTTMGELREGDAVLTPAGGTALVEHIYDRGEREVFTVTRADGVRTRACGEHMWEVYVEE